MKSSDLEKVLARYCEDIRKHGEKIPGHFEKEDVHELRVTYKKLRAFMRVIRMDKETEGKPEIPGKLTDLYAAAGPVRDLQLFISEIEVYAKENGLDLSSYLSILNKKLFDAKQELVKAIEKETFAKSFDKLRTELPDSLQEETPVKFIRVKAAAIQIIVMVADSDDDLHSIRKQLKDILYTLRIFELDWKLIFPRSVWKNEEELDALGSLLGNYNDLYIANSFLHSLEDLDLGSDARNKLLELRSHWSEKKQEIKNSLLNQITMKEFNNTKKI
jgi:CHAD domain-containing protein